MYATKELTKQPVKCIRPALFQTHYNRKMYAGKFAADSKLFRIEVMKANCKEVPQWYWVIKWRVKFTLSKYKVVLKG